MRERFDAALAYDGEERADVYLGGGEECRAEGVDGGPGGGGGVGEGGKLDDFAHEGEAVGV